MSSWVLLMLLSTEKSVLAVINFSIKFILLACAGCECPLPPRAEPAHQIRSTLSITQFLKIYYARDPFQIFF